MGLLAGSGVGSGGSADDGRSVVVVPLVVLFVMLRVMLLVMISPILAPLVFIVVLLLSLTWYWSVFS